MTGATFRATVRNTLAALAPGLLERLRAARRALGNRPARGAGVPAI